MSILYTLKKWADSICYREEEGRVKEALKVVPPNPGGTGDGEGPALLLGGRTVFFQCRLCGEGREERLQEPSAEPRFCHRCLAATCVPTERRRG